MSFSSRVLGWWKRSSIRERRLAVLVTAAAAVLSLYVLTSHGYQFDLQWQNGHLHVAPAAHP